MDHTTVYRYEAPVVLEPHIFRLRPRTNSAQRVLSFDLQITPPPAGTAECLDQDGNLALNAWFHSPTSALHVRSQFTAETLRENPFDYVLTGESLTLPLWYRESLSLALAPYRNDKNVSDSVKLFATSIAAGSPGDALLFLTAANWTIYHKFRQVVRPDGPAWTSAQTLQAMEGSCRDLAVLLCDICRAMGIAARFVSGYEGASATSDHPYMHAWAEVYLPVIGWRGYDPSRGLAVSNQHIALAAGFDPELAAPVSGWYSGAFGSAMETSLTLTIESNGAGYTT